MRPTISAPTSPPRVPSTALRTLVAVTLLLSGFVVAAVGGTSTPASAKGDPGDGYATFVYGTYNQGSGVQTGNATIPNCGPININGRAPGGSQGFARWSVGSSVANGATIPVGTVIELTATVYSEVYKSNGNNGPDPLFLGLPLEGPVAEHAPTVGDFPGGTFPHHGSGSVGPIEPLPGFAHSFDTNSSPSVIWPGDGAWVRMRAQARATAPGTITLDALKVYGFDSTPIAGWFDCAMTLPFTWNVRAPFPPFAGGDFASTDTPHPFENFGDANGGEHGIAIDVLANDSDTEIGGTPGDTSQVRIRDWQPLSASGATVSCGTPQQKGTAAFASMSTGPCTYRPVPGFQGVDTFSYVIQSAATGLQRFGLVSIDVVPNRRPVVGTPEYALNELQQIVDGDLGPVVVDPDGDPIACSLVTGPAGLTVDADCTFDFTPAGPGATSFTFRACDTHPLRTPAQHGASTTRLAGYHLGDPDDLSATQSRRCQDRNVPVSVFAANDAFVAPPIAGVDTDVVDAWYADAGYGPFSLELDVLANDIDPNGPDPSDADAWTGTLAILTAPDPATGTATVPGGPGSRTVRVTPAEGYEGPLELTYRVCEDPSAQNPPYEDDPDTPLIDEGLPFCGVGTVSVTVLPNAAPVPGDDEVLTSSLEPIVGFDVGENDTDPEGASLSCTPGALAAAPDGLLASAEISAGCLLDVTPVPGSVGVATLSYEVCDEHPLANPGQPATPYGANGESVGDAVSRCATAQVTVTIVAPAADVPGAFELDPDPICRDDASATDRDRAVDIAVLDNDEDVDLQGDPFPLAVVFAGLADAPGASEEGGTVVVDPDERTVAYTPPEGFTGSDTFAYTAQGSLGEGCSAVVTVVVSGVEGDEDDQDHRERAADPGARPSNGDERAAGGTLARTGDGVGFPLLAGVLSLLLGGALTVGSRRSSWRWPKWARS